MPFLNLLRYFPCFFISSIFFSLSLFSQSYQQAKPWMGVAIENKPEGVSVRDSIPGTPAEKAGFQKGDLIKKIDSTSILDSAGLISYIQSKGVGNQVTVELERNSKTLKLTLQLEARPDDLEVLRKKLVSTKLPIIPLESISPKSHPATFIPEQGVTVIEFWATWCPACVNSHTRLSDFAKENPKIRVLAVSNEKRDLLGAYFTKRKPHFEILRDGANELSKHFQVSAIPMTVVVDSSGIIQFVTLGAGSNLEEALQFALKIHNQ
jgi:thiol-disulfide isomerase/thioredoxin